MKEEAAAAAATEADSTTAGKEQKLRLSQKFIDYLLYTWQPETVEDPDEYYARMIKDPAFSREYVERRTETQRELAALFKRCAEMIAEYRDRVRVEFEEKGYVEVDEDYMSEEMEEGDEEFPEAFGPMDGLVSDATPQSVIDEIDGRVSEST